MNEAGNFGTADRSADSLDGTIDGAIFDQDNMELCRAYELKLKQKEMEIEKLRNASMISREQQFNLMKHNRQNDFNQQQHNHMLGRSKAFSSENQLPTQFRYQNTQSLNPFFQAPSTSKQNKDFPFQDQTNFASSASLQNNVAPVTQKQQRSLNDDVKLVPFKEWMNKNAKSRGKRGGDMKKRAFFASKYVKKNHTMETLGNVASFHIALANEAAKTEKTNKKQNGRKYQRKQY